MTTIGRERVSAHRVKDSSEDLVVGHFDFVLIGASWDQRCLSVTRSSNAEYGEVHLLQYEPATAGSSEAANLGFLHDYFASRSNDVKVLTVNSRELVGGFNSLRQSLLVCAMEAGRPIDVLLDLNSIPRYWTLGLLAFASRASLTRTFSVMYADAADYTVSSDTTDDYSFTSGEWAPVTVPGLGRPTGAAATSHLIVSGGFEGRKTRRLVHALEPDRLSILLANSSDDHLQISRRANAGIADDFGVSAESVAYAQLMDLPGLIDEVSRLADAHQGDGSPEEAEQLSYLLAGPKLASFAMAVSALDRRVAQVYYVAPERRNIASSATIGNYLFCTLKV